MIGLPKGLSARLLLLTFAFVMVSVVLVFVPSVARFRFNYLEDRIEAARLAILTLEATPDFMVSQELANKLLAHVGAHGIAEHRSSLARPLMIDAPTPPHIDRTYDLHEAGLIELMGDAVMTLADHDDHILRVLEVSDMNSEKSIIEVLLDEAPMRAQMWDFGARVLELSIIISLVTAALLYVSLQWLLVAPLRRLTSSMISFRKDPEDASRIIGTSTRADELGLAQREFSILQETVRQALRQKERLAALGTAVTKINHDLRSILSTVRLMSDALADSEAPEVKRVLPTLIAAIDRAVSLCTRTLNFTGENAPALACRPFALGELVAELVPTLASCGENPPTLVNRVGSGLIVSADRDQLFRVLSNLVRNADEAGAQMITLSAEPAAEGTVIEVSDDGPGLPPKARDNLFRPFTGSARPGGTGLGLAIAREIMRAHGGEIRLVRSTAAGTVFSLFLPCSDDQSRTNVSALR